MTVIINNDFPDTQFEVLGVVEGFTIIDMMDVLKRYLNIGYSDPLIVLKEGNLLTNCSDFAKMIDNYGIFIIFIKYGT